MLDHFHDGGGVKSSEALVAIDQRAVQELHWCGLFFWKSLQFEAAGGEFECAEGDVETDNLL